MDYTREAAFQIIRAAGEFSDYLSRATGKRFRLFKPMVKDGNNRVVAKFVSRKSKHIDGVTYWPMFLFKLEYDVGLDEYRVETEFWDDLKRGKPAFNWESRSTMPLENVFEPSIVFRVFIDKAAKRIKVGPPNDMKTPNRRAIRQNTREKGGKKFEIRMPMQRAGRMVYATYVGNEVKLSPKDEASGVTRKFSLKGSGDGLYVFTIQRNHQYMLTKTKNYDWSIIAKGTMLDNPVPEVIAR